MPTLQRFGVPCEGSFMSELKNIRRLGIFSHLEVETGQKLLPGVGRWHQSTEHTSWASKHPAGSGMWWRKFRHIPVRAG